MRSKKSRVVLWAALAVFLAGSLLALPRLSPPAERAYGSVVLRSGPMEFDRAGWCSNETGLFSYPARYRMARHALLHVRLTGMSRAKVRALLDCPMEVGTAVGDHSLVYSVRKLDDSQYQFLTVQFDADGTVVKVIPPRAVN